MTSQHASSSSRAPWLVATVIGVVAAVLGITAGLSFAGSRPDAAGSVSAEPTEASGGQSPAASGAPDLTQVAPPIPAIPTVTFSLVAVGDVLTHTPVMESAQSGSGYDFSKQLEPTTEFVRGGDIALCHLEVPVAPKGTAPSGYPMFGAPAAIVDDLAAAGWDGCSNASNHSVDRGFAGIEATLDAMQAADMGYAGTARSEAEAATVQFYNVVEGGRTIKVANISYTYGLNGLPKPAGKPWAVNVFDASSADVTPILEAAADARDKGADIVVSSVHCCVEYATAPSSTQASIVEQIAESGLVDLYVGHHAHVPQPIARLEGGPGGDGMWAAYGLGNFISNQDSTTVGVPESSNGIMLTATFTVDPDDHVSVEAGWTAITVDRTGGHVVYPITENSGAVGGLSASTVKSRWAMVADAAGDEATEIATPGAPLADFVWHNVRTP